MTILSEPSYPFPFDRAALGAEIDDIRQRNVDMRLALDKVEKYLLTPASSDQLADGRERVALLVIVQFVLRRWS